MPTFGIGGRMYTRALAVAGCEPTEGGSAAAAAPAIQLPSPGPDPTTSDTLAVEPSDSSAAGSGPWVERSAATGSRYVPKRAAATTATAPPTRRRAGTGSPPGSVEASSRARAKRPAQAITRLARMAVLVQNSRLVGPSSSTD